MRKQTARALQDQAKVKVVAATARHQEQQFVYLLGLAATALAGAAYVMGFFFSFNFTGGRAPTGN